MQIPWAMGYRVARALVHTSVAGLNGYFAEAGVFPPKPFDGDATPGSRSWRDGFGAVDPSITVRGAATGGPGGDPSFTEGGVGRSYLIDRGVPAEAVIVEEEHPVVRPVLLADHQVELPTGQRVERVAYADLLLLT